MKKVVHVFSFLIALSFIFLDSISKQENVRNLTQNEMKVIVAGDACSTSQFLNILAWVAAPFFPPFGVILPYVTSLDVTEDCPTEGSTGAPCDPCPNGGYEEEYSNCQQIGGQILGQSQCSTSSNRICCAD